MLSKRNRTNLLDRVYNSELTSHKLNLYTTGGGTPAIGVLTGIPGASNSIIEARLPYATSVTDRIIKPFLDSPNGYCNKEVALALTQAAYSDTISTYLEETKNLDSLTTCNFIGIGTTSAIRSKTIKKGDHRMHAFYKKSDNVFSPECVQYDFILSKGKRSREEEDQVIADVILNKILADATNLETEVPENEYLFEEEQIIKTVHQLDNPIDAVLGGNTKFALFIPNSNSTIAFTDIKIKNAIIFPGSFNPLTIGHIQLIIKAINHLGFSLEDHPPIILEIGLNADKGALTKVQIEERINQISDQLKIHGLKNIGIAVTSSPLYSQKTEIFQECTFLVGADTAIRLLDPKYTQNCLFELIYSLTLIQSRGTKFLIGPRLTSIKNKDGIVSEAFLSLKEILDISQVKLPDKCREMFLEIPEFRVDFSSTLVRDAKQLVTKLTDIHPEIAREIQLTLDDKSIESVEKLKILISSANELI